MIDHVHAYTVPAAYSLLPEAMRSPEATALLLAIGAQESRFESRRQCSGPARGFWQFEPAGVRGVLDHSASHVPIRAVLRALRYGEADHAGEILHALEHNDTLAACFARCLLWTLPGRLPGPNDAEEGWMLYREAWRPGKPRRETWTANYAIGWGAVLQGRTIPPVVKA